MWVRQLLLHCRFPSDQGITVSRDAFLCPCPCPCCCVCSGVQVLLGPAPLDKLLRDTLDIRDIPGAVQRPKTPAARAAAARAAAVRVRPGSGNSTPRARSSSSANNSSCRPGVLDVADIEGASAAWRPAHRCAIAHQRCCNLSPSAQPPLCQLGSRSWLVAQACRYVTSLRHLGSTTTLVETRAMRFGQLLWPCQAF